MRGTSLGQPGRGKNVPTRTDGPSERGSLSPPPARASRGDRLGTQCQSCERASSLRGSSATARRVHHTRAHAQLAAVRGQASRWVYASPDVEQQAHSKVDRRPSQAPEADQKRTRRAGVQYGYQRLQQPRCPICPPGGLRLAGRDRATQRFRRRPVLPGHADRVCQHLARFSHLHPSSATASSSAPCLTARAAAGPGAPAGERGRRG